MRRSKIGKYGKAMTPAEMKEPRVKTVLSYISSILIFAGAIGIVWNMIFAEKPLFDGIAGLFDGAEVEDTSLAIQQSVNSYIESNKELKGDEKVTLEEDAEWAKYQDRIRDETRHAGRAKSYYDIKVGEKKIGELEAPRVSTINVRGTVDHYTIEIYSAYSGKYSDFDDRHIYDSAKDNSK